MDLFSGLFWSISRVSGLSGPILGAFRVFSEGFGSI